MKAYKSLTDDSLRLFRPDMNMTRLKNSMDRLSMPGCDFESQELINCIAELVRIGVVFATAIEAIDERGTGPFGWSVGGLQDLLLMRRDLWYWDVQVAFYKVRYGAVEVGLAADAVGSGDT